MDIGGLIASTPATAVQAMGAVMPSVAYACVRLAMKVPNVNSVSTGLALVPLSRGTLDLAVSRSAGVSTGQPVIMSVGPVLVQPDGGEVSVSTVSWMQAGV
ncbi:hypothetical protein A6R68_16910 [Neotoma lepida]|uniref:Uncharacterized protein n=1 Tax=Neotoma lepida TaxID=56216 RepID=A0A1A6HDI1_NEOLE|nr:hypothetical protein A6R68_16910 [Neotoma lepida]